MAPPVILMAALGAAGQIFGGYSANQAAKRQASALEAQGELAQQEADREAQLHANDVRKFARTQTLAFLKNGVTLDGSPLLVVDETIRTGQEEVNSIVKSGAAQRTLYNAKAAGVRNEGRASMIGGILGGASSFGASMIGSSAFSSGGGSVSGAGHSLGSQIASGYGGY